MNLPVYKNEDQTLQLMQTKWKSVLDPVLAIPFLDGVALTNIAIVSGVNIINHKLQRQQQGWILTDVSGPNNISRSQPFNKTTLALSSSVSLTISLWVY